MVSRVQNVLENAITRTLCVSQSREKRGCSLCRKLPMHANEREKTMMMTECGAVDMPGYLPTAYRTSEN